MVQYNTSLRGKVQIIPSRKECYTMLAIVFCGQLKDCLNSEGVRPVFNLNNLLNDCEYSKPSS